MELNNEKNSSEDLVAQRFSRAANSYDAHANVHRAVAEYLVNRYGAWPSSQDVLDLGCGTGIVTKELCKRYVPSQIVGIDVSHEMLQQCEQLGIRLLQADFTKLPITEPFKTIYSSMSLQWCSDENEVYSCLDQLLLPKGKFAVSIVLKGTFLKLSELRKEILLNRNPSVTPHSPSEDLPEFNALRESLSKGNLTLYGSEKHIFTDYFKDTEDLFESIKGLGISGQSHTPLLKNEFLELKRLMNKHFVENDITPQLPYEVGFFWGEKEN